MCNVREGALYEKREGGGVGGTNERSTAESWGDGVWGSFQRNKERKILRRESQVEKKVTTKSRVVGAGTFEKSLLVILFTNGQTPSPNLA